MSCEAADASASLPSPSSAISSDPTSSSTPSSPSSSSSSPSPARTTLASSSTPPSSSSSPPPSMQCHYCQKARAVLKRPKNSLRCCKSCFLARFEAEVHETIVSQRLFEAGEKIAVCCSGGKDSTVLAFILNKLNRVHSYQLDLFLLSIDEGIRGYRDDSLKSVVEQGLLYQLPLHIVSYRSLYGYSMDEVVSLLGKSSNCTFCGVFRRQAIDRGAVKLCADKVVTGHNADDLAETVLMNLLRGDVARLDRSVDIITGQGKRQQRQREMEQRKIRRQERELAAKRRQDKISNREEKSDPLNDAEAVANDLAQSTLDSAEIDDNELEDEEDDDDDEDDEEQEEDGSSWSLPRVKPFKYCYEKEIVLYAYYAGLPYFSTECLYSPYAYRGYARELIKDLERCEPSAILNLIRSGESLQLRKDAVKKRQNAGKGQRQNCTRCGYISSNALCKACDMLLVLEKAREARNAATLNSASTHASAVSSSAPLPSVASAPVHIAFEKDAPASNSPLSDSPFAALTTVVYAPSDVAWEEAIDVNSVNERARAAQVFARTSAVSSAAHRGDKAAVLRVKPAASTAATHAHVNSTQW